MAGRERKYKSWQMVIPNTCEEALLKCERITSVGSVLPKSMTSRKAHHKPQWVWAVKSQRNINSILLQIRPYLVVKADVVDDFFAEWQDVSHAA